MTWTYDQGYLVAGSDRGVAERAIATRNGGSPLVWSPAFLGQLPSSLDFIRRLRLAECQGRIGNAVNPGAKPGTR